MNLTTEQIFEIRELVRAEICRCRSAVIDPEVLTDTTHTDKIKRLDNILLVLIPQSQPIDTSGGLAQALAHATSSKEDGAT